MRKRQGTRRVYFKDLFYEGTFSALPSANWAYVAGTNSWALKTSHPDGVSYYPWNSNYHCGNFMQVPNAAGWHSCIATQTSAKLNNTRQHYLDPTSTEGGLEPIIYEFCFYRTTTGDVTFVFEYDTAVSVGLGLRFRNTGGAGTAVMELSIVDMTSPSSPSFTLSKQWEIDDPGTTQLCFVRMYYIPMEFKYGGETLSTTGSLRVYLSEGDSDEMPWLYLEGSSGETNAYTYDTGDHSITGAHRRTYGDSLMWVVGANTTSQVGWVKYCRNWDYGLQSVTWLNRLTIGDGFMNFTLAKPRDAGFYLDEDAQIGYQIGDRIELQIKSRRTDYLDPPNYYHATSIIDFDGFIDDVKQKGGTQDRVDITARDYYGQMIKHMATYTFSASSDLETAFKTLAPFSALAYRSSAFNGYGVDSALSGTTFNGAKDYKGLSGHDVARRLHLYANTWGCWHPCGTWVVTKDIPDDAAYVMNFNNNSEQNYIVHFEEVYQGRKMVNFVDVMGGATTQTEQDTNYGDDYMDRGTGWVDSREVDTTDMESIGLNIIGAWKYKRRILDVYTYQGMGWIRPGDLVTLTIPGLDISSVDFQVIQKRGFWGERFPTMHNILIFRLCEKITNVPPIWYVGKNEEIMDIAHTGREAYGQHA